MYDDTIIDQFIVDFYSTRDEDLDYQNRTRMEEV